MDPATEHPALDVTAPDLLPVACTLGPEDARSRLLRWQRLRESADPVGRLDGGRLEVRYRPDTGVRAELTELATAEQECCAFATWSVSEVGGEPVLHVVSPGAPEALVHIATLVGAAPTA